MTPDDIKRAVAQLKALAPEEALPELRELVVGREAYEAFTTKVDRVHVDLEGPLGWFASQGVKVSLATHPDWPPRAIVGVDRDGKWHSLVEANGERRRIA